MSCWTKISGVATLTNMEFLKPKYKVFRKQKKIIEKILGDISTFEKRKETTLPNGGEGSLSYKINLMEGFIIVNFIGNLRGYGTEGKFKDLEQWFNKVIADFVEYNEKQDTDSEKYNYENWFALESFILMASNSYNDVITLGYENGEKIIINRVKNK